MKLILVLSIALLGACTTGPYKKDRDPASIIEVGDPKARQLTNDIILQYSSSRNLRVGEMKIITDNTDALQSKIDIIRKAKNDLVLMYYIFGTDESSSHLSKEILMAAQRGVKVRILVDFFVNYKNYDFFRMLEEKSGGNIQVAFYGVPSTPLLKSLTYLVSPCKEQNKTCVPEKWNAITQEYAQGKVPFFTKLALTGLYGKTPNVAKIAFSAGTQIDLSKGAQLTAEEKKQLEEFIKLVFRAKIQGDVGAKLKLAMALAFYGKDTLPVYERLLALFPLAGGPENLSGHWNNATDFIHHKLIMADGRYVQLGGRNIEDSYHMPLSPSGKYTFLDTDVAAEVLDGGGDIKATYDRMWNFKDSVRSLKNLDAVVAHNYLAEENLVALVGAIQKCESSKVTPNYSACIEKTAEAQLALKMSDRVARANANLEKGNTTYLSKNIAHASTAIPMNDPNHFITYLENLSFKKSDSQSKRLFGAAGDKDITELWVKSIKNTCYEASRDPKTPREITLLNAYVFLPASVYMTLADVLNGRTKCPNTTVTIATNSIESTDLAPVNMFATYQLLNLAKEVKPDKKGVNAKLRILELKKVANPNNPAATYSLHTKASIFGDDLIIGSANADIRSYHMDSNNAFFIRGTPVLAAEYKKWVNDFIDPTKGRFADKTADYRNLKSEQAHVINGKTFDYMVSKYKIAPDTKAKLRSLFMDTCADVSTDSKYFVSPAVQRADPRDIQRLKSRAEEFDSKYQVF